MVLSMPPHVEETLKKITLNLFEKDIAWFKTRYGEGYTLIIRLAVRKHRRFVEDMEDG